MCVYTRGGLFADSPDALYIAARARLCRFIAAPYTGTVSVYLFPCGALALVSRTIYSLLFSPTMPACTCIIAKAFLQFCLRAKLISARPPYPSGVCAALLPLATNERRVFIKSLFFIRFSFPIHSRPLSPAAYSLTSFIPSFNDKIHVEFHFPRLIYSRI